MNTTFEDPKASYFIISYDDGDVSPCTMLDALSSIDLDEYQILKLSEGVLYSWEGYWRALNNSDDTEGMGL